MSPLSVQLHVHDLLIALDSLSNDLNLPMILCCSVTTSAVNLMWAMFGLIDTNDYDSYNELETFLGLLLLALWLVSSIIVLTNMLVRHTSPLVFF